MALFALLLWISELANAAILATCPICLEPWLVRAARDAVVGLLACAVVTVRMAILLTAHAVALLAITGGEPPVITDTVGVAVIVDLAVAPTALQVITRMYSLPDNS